MKDLGFAQPKHQPVSYNPKIVTAFFAEFGIPAPDFEHQFHPSRRWRLDLSWKEFKVAVEVQGGLWIRGGGRHQRGAAMLKEWEKLNELAAMGYRVIYCQPCDICTTQTALLVKRALGL